MYSSFKIGLYVFEPSPHIAPRRNEITRSHGFTGSGHTRRLVRDENQPEVTENKLLVFGHKNIGRLDVPMDDVILVKKRDGMHQ